MPDYVAYYRISPGGRRKATKELRADVAAREDHILGLDAQRSSVARFLHGQAPIAEFTEIESGKRHENRPKLTDAMRECKRRKATLLIAKLDRLARNVHFITGLMESGVDFTCCDMPTADRTMIQMMAVFAEHERRTISERIKAALAQLKLQGVKLGNKDMAGMCEKAKLALRQTQPGASPETKMLIEAWRSQGYTFLKIANELNAKGVKAPRGKTWWASSVRNQLKESKTTNKFTATSSAFSILTPTATPRRTPFRNASNATSSAISGVPRRSPASWVSSVKHP